MKFRKEPRVYTEEQILKKFQKLGPIEKEKILEEALARALNRKAGTRAYAIASSMGFAYQDDGTYLK